MSSRLILALHTLLFLSFAGFSLSSPFIAAANPAFFKSPYTLMAAIVVAAVVIASWPLAGGCPLTIWENNARRAERRKTYTKGCIQHYVQRWFGISISGHFSDTVQVILLALPIAVATLT